MPGILVFCPVAPIEVVFEVAQGAALFFAKATVPLALGHLSGNRLVFSCGFLYFVSFKLGTLLAPSTRNFSPCLMVFVELDFYSVFA